MKLVTFEHTGSRRAGVCVDDSVVDVHAVDPTLPGDTTGILAGGEPVREAIQKALGSADRLPLSSVRLLAPVPRPGKIICVGQNYWDHCREQNVEAPKSPILFAKWNNAVLAPGDAIHLSTLTDQVDYEAELALVIGKVGRNIPEESALDWVGGYTCLNDVSARDIQFGDKQWSRGKSFDTFCPMGPWLVTADEIPDPQALSLRCTVSGEVLQDSSTSEMIFNCAFLLSYISRSMTLEPGDLISTGTPNGVGVFRKPPRFLKTGDTVTVSVGSIGELTNPVVEG